MSERRAILARLAPAVLLIGLALAWLLPDPPSLRLTTSDTQPAEAWAAALDALPDAPLVLVGFDPDVGTYAEVRPTVRAAIADLLNRNARLALVSLTPEGRALLVTELDRLRRSEVNVARLLDLGYLPGAEAALVSIAAAPPLPSGAAGEVARRLSEDGTDAVDAVLVVGGNDLGPRSWVEQVAPRVPGTPIVAIAPTVLLPELQPYLASGQLAALLGTPRDGATYRAAVDVGSLGRLREQGEPPIAALMLGLFVAVVVVGQAWGRRLVDQVREGRHDGRHDGREGG
jgi:hypothetical protein